VIGDLPPAAQCEPVTQDSDLRALRISEKELAGLSLKAELGARQRALPDQRYDVILTDPAWCFESP
jgi:hypothetical protein